MKLEEANHFAENWISAWNSHDINAVLGCTHKFRQTRGGIIQSIVILQTISNYMNNITKILTMFAILLFPGVIQADNGEYSHAKIILHNDHIKKINRPGRKPIMIYGLNLSELLPELSNQRVIKISDIPEKFSEVFIDAGFHFVHTGDINNDNISDIVFVGKYHEVNNSEKCFLAIITFDEKSIIRTFLYKSELNMLYLHNIYINNKEFIGVTSNLLQGETYIRWDGNKYNLEPIPGAD